MKRDVNLFVNVLNLFFSVLAGKIIPIATIFLFSHMMTISDYGVLSIFTSYIWFFAIVMSLNMHTALGRYAYISNGDLPSFFGTLLIAIGFVFLFVSIVLWIGRYYIEVWTGLPMVMLLLMVFVVAGVLAESLLTQWAIYREKSDVLAKTITGKAMLTLFLSIIFLLSGIYEGYIAVAAAEALMSLFMLCFVLYLLNREAKWRFDFNILVYVIKYSIPLIPYALSITLLAQVDRIMIDKIYGKEATALYSIAFNVGMIFLLVITAINNAMNPRFFSAMESGDYVKVVFDGRKTFTIGFVLALGIVLLGPTLMRFLLPLQYEEALPSISVIAVAGLFLGLFQIWGRILHYYNLTGWISGIAFLCVIMKIIINTILLPLMGWEVAALSTVVAYAFMALFVFAVVNVKKLGFKFPCGYELILCIFLLLICFFGNQKLVELI